jgi:hypothetical protein
MRQCRTSLIAVAAVALLWPACGQVQRMTQVVGALSRLHDDVKKSTAAEQVVVKVDEGIVTVQVVNSRLTGVAPQDLRPKVEEIAKAAYRAVAPLTRVVSIQVAAVQRTRYLLFFDHSQSSEYKWEGKELEGLGDGLGVQPAVSGPELGGSVEG